MYFLQSAARRALTVAGAGVVALYGSERRAAFLEPSVPQRLACLEQRVEVLEGAPSRTRAVAGSWAADALDADALYTEREIATMVESLAAQITRDYADDDELLVIGLLDGVFVFLADLTRALGTRHTVDFISASSYGMGTVSSGNVRIKKDASASVTGKHVLIVDEMCDSGRTLASRAASGDAVDARDVGRRSLKALLEQRNAKSVKTCVLLDKVSRRTEDVRPDYVGAVCPDEFVVGYGMDWGGKYRSLPFIGVVKRALYAPP